jgi:long-subunit fatty acid transport protein
MASRLHQEDGIYNNQSAEYVRTLNRNASTDADAAFYNPAGLAFMEMTGLYVMFSSQTYYKKRLHSMDYTGINVAGVTPGFVHTQNTQAGFVTSRPGGGIDGNNSYYAEVTAPILPDLNIVYHGNTRGHDWSVFLTLGMMQAAPDFTYPKGLAVVDWGNLAVAETLYLVTGGADPLTSYMCEENVAIRTEYFIGATVGAAYKITEWFAAGLGLRYIYAMGGQTITVKNPTFTTVNHSPLESGINNDTSTGMSDWKIDTEYEGHGIGLVVSIDFQPVKKLIMAFRYEWYAPMEAKKKTNHFMAPTNIEGSGQLDIFKDGTVTEMDDGRACNGKAGDKTLILTYPQSVSFGLSYIILKNLRFEVSGDMYLRPYVRMNKVYQVVDYFGGEPVYTSYNREEDFNIGFRAGGCIEYAPLECWKISIGYSYNDPGIKASKRSEVDPLLTSHTIGAGFGFVVNDRLVINLGGFYTIFKEEEIVSVSETVSPTGFRVQHEVEKVLGEKIFSVGLGITYRFLGAKSTAKKDSKNEAKHAGLMY